MLRMTKQADYGIVLMTTMAKNGERRYTAPGLATATQIPSPMVSKILKLLNRGGLLRSQRGARGGYSLARDPARISVASMIEALEGPIAFTECSEESPGCCSQEASCQLRSTWQRINFALRQALEEISLAELTRPATSPGVTDLVTLRSGAGPEPPG